VPHYRLGLIAYFQGNYPAAIAWLTEGLRLEREKGDELNVQSHLVILGVVASLQGQPDAAEACFREASHLAREIHVNFYTQLLLTNTGLGAYYVGDLARSAELLEQVVRLARERGTLANLGIGCYALAQTLYQLGDHARSAELVEEGLAAEPLYLRAVALLLGVRARLALARNDLAQASQDLRESLAHRRRMGARRDVAEALEWAASLAVRQGQPLHAARLLGAAQALREQIGAPLPVVERPDYERTLALVTAELDPTALQMAWDECGALSWDQAADLAIDAL
jgi:tetratricopeptide (TPR) repeat protein